MVFTHDTGVALQAAVALVNSAEDPDTLTSLAELDAYFDAWDYTGRRVRTRAGLEEVRALRPRLRALLTAPRDQAAEMVNRMLADAQAVPQLVRHQPFDWHLHAIAGDQPLAERIVVETAMAMVDVVRGDEHSRIAVCDAPDCEGLVLDLSRNRSRKFCSTTCGNRVAVAAYRARQA